VEDHRTAIGVGLGVVAAATGVGGPRRGGIFGIEAGTLGVISFGAGVASFLTDLQDCAAKPSVKGCTGAALNGVAAGLGYGGLRFAEGSVAHGLLGAKALATGLGGLGYDAAVLFAEHCRMGRGPMTRIPGLLTKDAYAKQWAPKVGTRGTHLKWRITVYLGRAWMCMWLGGACVVAGSAARLPVLTVLGAVILGLMIVFYVAGLVSLSASKKAIGELLGLKIGRSGAVSPPRDPKNYEKWCAKYGVVPYTALQREAERARSKPVG